MYQLNNDLNIEGIVPGCELYLRVRDTVAYITDYGDLMPSKKITFNGEGRMVGRYREIIFASDDIFASNETRYGFFIRFGDCSLDTRFVDTEVVTMKRYLDVIPSSITHIIAIPQR